MKINPGSVTITGAVIAFLVAGSAVKSDAGPSPEFWNRLNPITSVKEAEVVKGDDPLVMVCGACKTALIRNSKHVGPPSKGSEQWLTIGSKHQCGHCGGEITVVQGKTSDSMQHNCSRCGEGAAFCCAPSSAPPKK